MKKFLLVLLLVLIILGGLFYKQILATIDFYQYQQRPEFDQAVMVWKEIPFTSTGRQGIAGDTLTFDALQIPIPFVGNNSVGSDAAFALGGSQSITVTRSDEAKDFFNNHSFSTTDEKAACQFLAKSSGLGACTSNYNLYRSLLELNQSDVHAFASIRDKTLYNRLLTIRSDAVPSQSVGGFETSRIRGFLFTIDKQNYVAHIFDSNDQMYTITFTNLNQSDVAFVLSNTTVN